jgi:hypothetical protein
MAQSVRAMRGRRRIIEGYCIICPCRAQFELASNPGMYAGGAYEVSRTVNSARRPAITKFREINFSWCCWLLNWNLEVQLKPMGRSAAREEALGAAVTPA